MFIGGAAHAEILLGKTPIYAVNYNFSTGNVSSAAFTQIVSSLPSSISYVQIQNNSGQILKIATGAAGSESVIPYLIPRGGTAYGGATSELYFTMRAFQRVSIQAALSTGTATTGELILNFFQ